MNLSLDFVSRTFSTHQNLKYGIFILKLLTLNIDQMLYGQSTPKR